MMRRVIYAGSFDPVTNGHLWTVEQAVDLFDEVIVAIGENPDKKYTFSFDDRLSTLSESLRLLAGVPNIESFAGKYLVNYAQSMKAQYILRGIRSADDYEFERGMRHVNNDLQPGITTVFLMPPREIAEVSSSLVKGLIGPEGWRDVVKRYVPKPVYDLILDRYSS